MATLEKPAHHIGPHPAKPDHSELHFRLLFSLMACLGVGRLKDALNGFIEQDVELGGGLLGLIRSRF
jgi:hypothetical protein